MRPIVTELLEKLRTEEDVFKVSSMLHQVIHDEQIPLTQVSRELGAKPSYVSHLMRIRKLPSLIVDGYYSKLVSLSHLFIISRLNTVNDMVAVYEKVLAGSLSTARTEELVREILYSVDSTGKRASRALVDEIVTHFHKQDVAVKVTQTRTKGKIVIEMKGNLARTSRFIEKLSKSLLEYQDEPPKLHSEKDS